MSRVQVPSAAPIQLADRLCRGPARDGGPGRKGTAGAGEARRETSLPLGGNARRVTLSSVGQSTQERCRSLPASPTHTTASLGALLRIELSPADPHDTCDPLDSSA